jgi:hypothetical protein
MTDLRPAPVAVAVVAVDDVPATTRSVAAMPDADYVDVSVLPSADATDWSPEEWARAVLESAPSARRFAFIPWRVFLGLRLGPWPSPDHVHGWKIAGQGDDWLRLETASWLMTCHVVVHVEDGQVSAALFVRYDHPIAALWWPPLSIGHRRAMPVILRQGRHVLRARKVAP